VKILCEIVKILSENVRDRENIDVIVAYLRISESHVTRMASRDWSESFECCTIYNYSAVPRSILRIDAREA